MGSNLTGDWYVFSWRWWCMMKTKKTDILPLALKQHPWADHFQATCSLAKTQLLVQAWKGPDLPEELGERHPHAHRDMLERHVRDMWERHVRMYIVVGGITSHKQMPMPRGPPRKTWRKTGHIRPLSIRGLHLTHFRLRAKQLSGRVREDSNFVEVRSSIRITA